jgi:hypothetical protein
MAARAAAAKPLLPTPAIPASPPIFVSISRSLSVTGGGGTCSRGGARILGGGLTSRWEENEGRAVVGEEGPENPEDTEPAFEVVLARKSPDGGGRVRRGDVLLLVGDLIAGEEVSFLLGARGLDLD